MGKEKRVGKIKFLNTRATNANRTYFWHIAYARSPQPLLFDRDTPSVFVSSAVSSCVASYCDFKPLIERSISAITMLPISGVNFIYMIGELKELLVLQLGRLTSFFHSLSCRFAFKKLNF